MDAIKYLYEVHPTKIIRIAGKPPVRRAFSAFLTKDEVKSYMGNARVYRKYDTATPSVLVTLSNLDQLHTGEVVSDNDESPVEKVDIVDENPVLTDENKTEDESPVESDSNPEDESKNLEEEVSSVDGKEDETTVAIENEVLPEASNEEKECEPKVVEETKPVQNENSNKPQNNHSSNNGTSFQVKGNNKNNHHKK